MTVHGLFISVPHHGRIYVAERSRKGSSKLLWSVMPEAPVAADVRIEAREVPRQIRRQAYRWLDVNRLPGTNDTRMDQAADCPPATPDLGESSPA